MKSRLFIVVFGAALWMGVVGWRLYDLQIARHDDYAYQARQQQRRIVELDAPRGTIFDARGRVLAASLEVDSLYADPGEIVDPDALVKSLGAIVPLDRRVRQRLEEDRDFVWLARKLDPEVAREVHDLRLEGVYALKESRRFYPHGELAGSVLGYVGMDNVGLAGLERQYDALVVGKEGRKVVLRDATGSVSDPGVELAPARPGSSLHLTLDAAIQYVAERELARAVEETNAKGGVAVVLDANSGALLALASNPGFDPNEFAAFPKSHWRNRGVQEVFEPGSTFKVITAAAALESGLIRPDDRFYCEMGAITLGRTRIRDHKAFGDLSFREIIAKSSNVGVIKAALVIGDQPLYDMMRAFGFGQRTGIDLPGESPGIVWPVQRWRDTSKAYMSFGHEVSITALQMANAFVALANGGHRSRPYVVERIGDRVVAQRTALGPDLPLSPATLDTLLEILRGVVAEGGTGRRAGVPGYSVLGKTGTAQKVLPGGGYSPTGRLASFVGMVPSTRPRLVGYVMIDEPRGRTHGGDVAAPVFAAIARQALVYLGVPPDEGKGPRRAFVAAEMMSPPLPERSRAGQSS